MWVWRERVCGCGGNRCVGVEGTGAHVGVEGTGAHVDVEGTGVSVWRTVWWGVVSSHVTTEALYRPEI